MKKRLIIIITIVFTSLAIIFATIFAANAYTNDRFAKETYISNIDISYLNESRARDLLAEKIEDFKNSSFFITINNQSKEILIKDLNINIYLDETLSSIEPVKASLFSLDFLKKHPANRIKLQYKIDKDHIEDYLEEKFDISDIRANNANYFINDNWQVDILDEVDGFIIDFSSFYQNIDNFIAELNLKDVSLELLDESPVLTRLDLESQKEKFSNLITQNIKLMDPVYSDDWDIRLIDYSDWIIFDNSEDNIIIKINQERLNNFIDEEISKWLDKDAEDVNLSMDEEGNVSTEGTGIDGMRVKREFFKQLIEDAINNEIYEVLIPIDIIEPKLTIDKELQDLGIKERLAVGHTSYYGSPTNRIHNIKVGADRFNGLLIAPGEEFSFNTNLGAVNAATGYRPELVIKADGTKPEYGGGLCQVSTTMYRTILFSGLPIDDRRAHSYAVSYYSQVMGHGLDATIYLGGQDLKFTNDTGAHILVQTYVKDDYELYIIFYGSSDGRKVEMEGPYLSNYHGPGPTQYITSPSLAPGQSKQVESRHVGFNALWYRYITDANGETIKETINSAYKAVPAKIMVGPETTLN